MKRCVLGRYLVIDPKICHGKMTFRGTRIFVSDVLDQVAEGMDWDVIVEQWNGHISKAAMAEAVRLASETLFTHTKDLIGQAARS